MPRRYTALVKLFTAPYVISLLPPPHSFERGANALDMPLNYYDSAYFYSSCLR